MLSLNFIIGLHIIIHRAAVGKEQRYKKIMRNSFCPFSILVQSHLYAVSYAEMSNLGTLHIILILLLVFIIKIVVYIDQGGSQLTISHSSM